MTMERLIPVRSPAGYDGLTRGARSFAAIIVKLTEAELAVVRRDEAFDDIIVWLARAAKNFSV